MRFELPNIRVVEILPETVYRLRYFVSPPPATGREPGPSAAYTLPSGSTATPSPAAPWGPLSVSCGGMKAVTLSSVVRPMRMPVFQPGWRAGLDSESIAYSVSLASMNNPLTRPN